MIGIGRDSRSLSISGEALAALALKPRLSAPRFKPSNVVPVLDVPTLCLAIERGSA
jgi:hypothetical protein